MVEKADTGFDAGFAATVQIDGEGDVCFTGHTMDRGSAGGSCAWS
jgi:hypothetical protein